MTENRMLNEAVKAIENGQLSRARDLLTRLLRQDQSNVAYWLYMSAVVETEKERTFCLENVLRYDPSNKTAAQGLVMLGVKQPDSAIRHIRPVNERKWEQPKILGEAVEEAPGKRKSRLSPVQVISLAIFGVISIALIFIGIFGNPFYTEPAYVYNNTIPPLLTSGPTPTYLPTNTPVGGIVNNLAGPTPLLFQLDATYTPTPRYIDTPHPVISAYDSGMISLDNGNYEQAIAFLQQAVDAAPGAYDILYYLGQAYLFDEDYDNARRYFDMVLQKNDLFAPAYIGKAKAFLGMDPERDVTELFYKAVSIDEEYIDARLAWADFKLYHGELEDALKDVEIAMEIDSENHQVYYYLAKIYIAQDRYEEALEAAQRAYELNMINPENHLLYGYAFILNDLFEEALPLIETYLSHVNDDYFGWYLLGRALLGAGDPASAVDIFKYTYSERKNIYEMSYYWGLALIEIGEYETAAERLLVPIQRTPRWFEPYAAQARAYYLNEEYNFAKEILEAGKDRAISDRQKATLYYWRGLIYTELGHPGLANASWEALLELPPSEVPAEWWSTAQTSLGSSGTPESTQEPTPTRVASPTPNP